MQRQRLAMDNGSANVRRFTMTMPAEANGTSGICFSEVSSGLTYTPRPTARKIRQPTLRDSRTKSSHDTTSWSDANDLFGAADDGDTDSDELCGPMLAVVLGLFGQLDYDDAIC